MKTQTKLVVFLVVTLFIGMALGFVGHGIFFRDQFKRRAQRMQTPDGFMQRFEQVIQPTDAQRAEIRKVLEKHYNQMMAHQETFRTNMDAFRNDLDSVLTEEQRKRLHDSFLKDRSRPFGKDSHHGRPPMPGDGPPPDAPPPDSLMR